jgi:SAM-dependent methyltransferase
MTAITLDEPATYFDRLAEFEAEHWWSTALWKLTCHWLNRYVVGRQIDCLDVGCGAGLTLARLASRPDVGQIVGVEPSPEAIGHSMLRDVVCLPTGVAQVACNLWGRSPRGKGGTSHTSGDVINSGPEATSNPYLLCLRHPAVASNRGHPIQPTNRLPRLWDSLACESG